ncbi:MAG: hypothetical protein ACLP8Y_08005 [Thermoplasmata archaeon]
MSAPDFIDGLLILGAVGFLGGGLALAGFCGGGGSLALFGGAVALIGVMLFRSGAWATAVPMAIATLLLVAGGWYGATVAGCHL